MQMGRDRRQRRRRAAVVGGAAVAAKKHDDAKEAQQAAAAAPKQAVPEPRQAVQPAAAGGLTPEVMEQLKQLGELHEQNVLSDEEFEREKAKLLDPA
jgi:Short C-terminal domain